MRKTFLTIVLAVLLLPVLGNGTKEIITSRSERLGLPITKNTLGAANMLDVWDQDYYAITTGAVAYTLTSYNTRAVLRYDNNVFKTMTEHGYSWRVQVYYKMHVNNAAGTLSTVPGTQMLEIYYDAAAGTPYVDEHIKVYPNALKARLEVTDIKVCTTAVGCSPVTMSTIPSFLKDIYLDLVQQSDYCFSSMATPRVFFENGTVPPSASPPGNVLPLAWTNTTGAESYDLEWLFVDNISPTSNVDFDFYNATRINTSHNFYEIPLVYPAGVLLFRVRAVGIANCGTSNEKYIYSGWSNFSSSSAGNTGSLGITVAAYRYNYNGLNTTMNWSYTATYAEEGKHKHAISYYDGLLKPRQAVTEISTDENVLVAETVYDYMGRPAVNILPAPFASSGIKYYNNFNVDYNAGNFDTDVLMDDADALNSGAKASSYYSAGSDYIANNGYLPVGNGYAFTQTRYKNDGTGRVIASSGPGVAHNMGSGHESKIAYGTAMGRELDKWFGNEVYLPGKYQKVLTRDANGQVSFAYLDQLGRTIAAGLTGDSPTSMDPIDVPGVIPVVTADLLLGSPSVVDGDKANYSKTIVTTGGTYTFNYELDPKAYDHDCYPLVNCIYNVSVSVADQYGNNIVPTVTVKDCNGVTPCPSSNYEVTADNQILFKNITQCNLTFTAALGFGSYTVTKAVELSTTEKDAYESGFFDTHIPEAVAYGCYPYPEIAPAPCPGTCEDLCTLNYTNGTNILGEPTYTPEGASVPVSAEDRLELIAECQEDCSALPEEFDSPCESKLKLMKLDMSPGGQYFDNLPYTFSFGGPGGSYSSSSTINNWLIARFGSLTVPSFFFSAGPSQLIPAPSCSGCTWNDIRSQWNDSWAGVMVKYHPEFCLYEAECGEVDCGNETIDMEGSADFDLAIIAPGIYMPSGKTLDNYLNPLNISPSSSLPTPILGNNTYWEPVHDINSVNDPMFPSGCLPTVCGSTNSKNYMIDKIMNYYPLGTTPEKYFSLWYVATDPQNIHSMTTPPVGSNITATTILHFQVLHGNPFTGEPGLISATPGPGQITPEEFTAQQYLGLKDYVKYLMIENSTCNYLTPDPTKPGENLTAAGFHIRFPVDEDFAGYDCETYNQIPAVPEPAEPDDGQLVICQDNCSTHVSDWMIQVRAQCDGLTTLQEENIEDYLLQVCLASCESSQTPMGSDDCGGCTSVTYTDGSGTHTFTTFDDVVSFFTASNPDPCQIDLCYPANDKDESACWCTALNAELSTEGLSPAVPGSPTGTELTAISSYLNTTYALTVNNTQVEAWLMECNKPFCASELVLTSNEFPQYLVDHVQENFAGGTCACEQLHTMLAYYGFEEADISNPTAMADFAADLNSEYGLSGGDELSGSEVTALFAECENTCVSISELRDLGLPEVMECETAEGVGLVTACMVQNQAVADAQEAAIYYNTITNATQEFIDDYSLTCMSDIDNLEDFTVSYPNYESMVTLYYYDQAGSLIKTVPPKGVATLSSFTNVDLYRADPVANAGSYSVPAHTYVTNYKHDSYGAVRQKTTPDGGVNRFYYDAKGRVAVSRISRQGAFSGYSYVLYDDLGRAKEAGELITTSPLTQEIVQWNTPVTHAAWLATATAKNDVVKTIYDAQGSFTNPFGSAERYLRNRVSAVTFDRNGDGTYENAQHYRYDIHGNVAELYNEQTLLAQIGQGLKHTLYTYDLVSGNVHEVRYQPGEYDQLYFKYDYDADNRMTRAYSSTNGYIYRKEQKQFYYPHGALKRTETGAQCVAGTDYAYTIQGWLKHLNASTLNIDRDMGADGKLQKTNADAVFVQDALAYTIGYWQDYVPTNYGSNLADYAPINGSTSVGATINTGTSFATDAKSLYNGNINYTITDIMTGINTSGAHTINVLPINVTAYNYDQANRFKRSMFYTDGSVRTNNVVGSISATNSYKMELAYDLNGNITALDRYGSSTTIMDDLSYTYQANTNRLSHVDDGGGSGVSTTDVEDQNINNYLYDFSGNLVSDAKENIQAIEWNARGKVRKIKKNKVQVGGQFLSDLEYIYNAMGQRIVKIVKPHHKPGASVVLSPQWNWTYTFYELDAQGNVLATYERKYIPQGGTSYKSEIRLLERYVYGSTRLGSIQRETPVINVDKFQNSFTASLTVTVTNDDDEYLVPTSGFGSNTFTVDPFSSGSYYEYSYRTGDRNYEQTNHLGNVISVIRDRKVPVDRYNFISTGGSYTHGMSTVIGTYVTGAPGLTHKISAGTDGKSDGWMAEVESYSDYYPFGARMDGRYNTPASGLYRYGYQGQEQDNEIKGDANSLNYEYRMHDPRLGRFFAIDPLTAKYPHYSPYSFSGNKVIHAVELEGLEEYELNGSAKKGYTLTYNMKAKPLGDLNTPIYLKQIYFNGKPTLLLSIPKINADLYTPTSGEHMVGNINYYKFRDYDFKVRHSLMQTGKDAPEYYLNYGDKYAHRFIEKTKPTLSADGQEWVDKTFVNLQEAMESGLSRNRLLELDSKKFRSFAFDTHVPAYEEAGLFALPYSDLIKIGMTPDLHDLLSEDGIRQIKRIAYDMVEAYVYAAEETVKEMINEPIRKAKSTILDYIPSVDRFKLPPFFGN